MMESLEKSAEIAIRQCMGVKSGESVLVVADKKLRNIGLALWEKAVDVGVEAIYMEMTARKENGEEPPAAVAAAMLAADVVLGVTSRSFTHTVARKQASKNGARIATLPGITEKMLQRTLNADYMAIARMSKKLAKVLTDGKLVHIFTPEGTNISISIEERSGYPDTGILHDAGDFGNLPAGEAYIAPKEGTANGVIVVDGSMGSIGILQKPIKLTVEKGYVTKIEGEQDAKKLKLILDKYDKEARNIAELGIGTNPQASLSGRVLEDEKVMGTVHLAIGSNIGFGGLVQVPIHLDGILLKPTLIIDEQVIIKDGKCLTS
ncbi:leucyl aminopeptidase (aminopeptidase T) [Sporomusaceae bacterium BoRhaA]|uniref:aminopeptidase n=1 Tax=Pelorhabdus rhamnosifermentans TaxID=2772457 RepID=UPI001C05F672|nr:aminopeptidase [Pelorhabdus rhamnosifermentans]MBU2700382.1 leucyl aminopeptidase (aminopeptidase T) [Pelorhabdus rhamnosifermentans]